MGNMQKLATAALLLAAGRGYGHILDTSASVRPDNSLIVDIQVTTSGNTAQVFATYEAEGVERLVSRLTPVSPNGVTTITIGRLRANTTYTYIVHEVDNDDESARSAHGKFTTGSLPPVLQRNTYTLDGRTTVPLVILPLVQTIADVGASKASSL